MAPAPRQQSLINAHLRSKDRSDSCCWCAEQVGPGRRTAEHLIPRDHGGPNWSENVMVACGPCNSRRATMTPQKFFEHRALHGADLTVLKACRARMAAKLEDLAAFARSAQDRQTAQTAAAMAAALTAPWQKPPKPTDTGDVCLFCGQTGPHITDGRYGDECLRTRPMAPGLPDDPRLTVFVCGRCLRLPHDIATLRAMFGRTRSSARQRAAGARMRWAGEQLRTVARDHDLPDLDRHATQLMGAAGCDTATMRNRLRQTRLAPHDTPRS